MIWSLSATGAVVGDLARQLTASLSGDLAQLTTGPNSVLTLTVAIVVVVALALARRQAALAYGARRGTHISVAARPAPGSEPIFIALTDPDAAQRPRPRAPTGRPASS